MAKRSAACADFEIQVGAYKAKIKVSGDDFSTCFAAGVQASDALKDTLRAAIKAKREAAACPTE